MGTKKQTFHERNYKGHERSGLKGGTMSHVSTTLKLQAGGVLGGYEPLEHHNECFY